MADQREVILSRLVSLCEAVPGVRGVVRNQLDAPALARPAVVIYDGVEELSDAPATGSPHSEVQRMELSPLITIIVRGGTSADPGVLLSNYRSKILVAILTDAAIRDALGTNGRARYNGCLVVPPEAEAKEHRMDINIAFRYVFKLDELAS